MLIHQNKAVYRTFTITISCICVIRNLQEMELIFKGIQKSFEFEKNVEIENSSLKGNRSSVKSKEGICLSRHFMEVCKNVF